MLINLPLLTVRQGQNLVQNWTKSIEKRHFELENEIEKKMKGE